MVAQQAGTVTSSGSGVLLSGPVPPLADAYYPREQSGPNLASSMRPGQTVVLVHDEESGQDSRVPAAQGGTGKTQLAVEFTHAMWNTRTVEILIWVNAASRESVITGFAQAANTVDTSQPAEGAETAAARFVSWLAHTRRPWALVIDDLAELSDLEDLWPSGASGRVLITTRLPASAFEDAVVEGGPAQGSIAEGMNLRVVSVPGLNRREALDYVTSRLSDYPDQRIEALDGLPLALAQATAAMSARRQGCREYRALLAERIGHMPAVPGASAAVLATWSIAAECAHELPPTGLAWPALVLAAMLDHHGVPGAVLTSPASCGYIAGRPSTANAADQNMVRAAINNLAQAGLVTIDPVSPVRTVQMHASVQAAVRAYLPTADLEQVVLAAADALLQTWPDGDGAGHRVAGDGPGQAVQAPFQQAQLEQALRDCTATLRTSDGGLLWKPEAHPLLFRAGLSLEHSRLSAAAITYWKSMVATSTRLLGPAHANAVVARDRLAAAYEAAGKSADAIAVFRTALAEREQHQGAEHPETIAARAHLAHAYQSAGRPADAIDLYERTVADSARLLGAAHPVTLGARASLAETYQASGEPREAIVAYEALLADAERHLGVGHPTTLGARASLGAAYAASGRTKDAIGQFQRALSDQERMRGPDHPDTIAARASLASAYRSAGEQKEAIAQYARGLADRERISGADHPDTIAARANLAYAHRSAGRLREAVPLYERTLADRVRVQGADHRDTLTARSNLAACYQQARRLTDAIPQYEKALADSERMLGPGDMETLTTRCNLASAYYTAGRLTDVVAVLQRALTDCERYLGPDHQMTDTVRANLEAATQV